MLIFDIEIYRAIPSRGVAIESDIEYCEGWEDHAGMDIAVLGCYDYTTDRYRIFCKDNLPEFFALVEEAECVVGFNNNRFDNRILEAKGCTIPPEKSYDILEEIWNSLGRRMQGYSLTDMCRANFNAAKVASGAVAPIRWQRGDIGTVIDYCLHDIYLTKRLLGQIIRCSSLVDPNNPSQTIRMRKPGAFFQRIGASNA